MHCRYERVGVSVVTLIMTMLLLPVQVAADVGLAWVQPTRGVSVALDPPTMSTRWTTSRRSVPR